METTYPLLSAQPPPPVVVAAPEAGKRPPGRPRKAATEVDDGPKPPTVEERMVPKGMVSLYMTVEPWPKGGICFVPTVDNTALPGSVQVGL